MTVASSLSTNAAALSILHFRVPDIAQTSVVHFEVLLCFYSVVAFGVQLVNMYKTVWWLPMSSINYAVNFHLIDTDLIVFVTLTISRRLVWCFVKLLSTIVGSPRGLFGKILQVIRFAPFIVHALLSVSFGIILLGKYITSVTQVVCLIQPYFCYILVYGISPLHLFEAWPLPVLTDRSKQPKRNNNIYHQCASLPNLNRAECEILAADYNVRISHVMFGSTFLAYHSTILPIILAHPNVYFDLSWTLLTALMFWLSCLLFVTTFYITPAYLHTIYTSAFHLGYWEKIDGDVPFYKKSVSELLGVRPTTGGVVAASLLLTPAPEWSENNVYAKESVVTFRGHRYVAMGQTNTAKPGDRLHARFWVFFTRPLAWTHGLTMAVLAVSFFLCYLLVVHAAHQWNRSITVALFLLINCYSIFLVVRNSVATSRLYSKNPRINVLLTESQLDQATVSGYLPQNLDT